MTFKAQVEQTHTGIDTHARKTILSNTFLPPLSIRMTVKELWSKESKFFPLSAQLSSEGVSPSKQKGSP